MGRLGRGQLGFISGKNRGNGRERSGRVFRYRNNRRPQILGIRGGNYNEFFGGDNDVSSESSSWDSSRNTLPTIRESSSSDSTLPLIRDTISSSGSSSNSSSGSSSNSSSGSSSNSSSGSSSNSSDGSSSSSYSPNGNDMCSEEYSSDELSSISTLDMSCFTDSSVSYFSASSDTSSGTSKGSWTSPDTSSVSTSDRSSRSNSSYYISSGSDIMTSSTSSSNSNSFSDNTSLSSSGGSYYNDSSSHGQNSEWWGRQERIGANFGQFMGLNNSIKLSVGIVNNLNPSKSDCKDFSSLGYRPITNKDYNSSDLRSFTPYCKVVKKESKRRFVGVGGDYPSQEEWLKVDRSSMEYINNIKYEIKTEIKTESKPDL